MKHRTIFYRVTILQHGEPVRGGGAFDDLKTLEGAIRRLERRFPRWREIEARYEPFERPEPDELERAQQAQDQAELDEQSFLDGERRCLAEG